MPRSRLLPLGLAATLLGAGAAVWVLRSGDEHRIRRAVADIQRQVARTPAESDLAALAAARRIALYFTDPFTVEAEPANFFTRDRRTLIGTIHQYRTRSAALYMRVYDEDLRLDPGGERAWLSLTAEFVRGVGDLAGAERYPITLHWRRIDGEWRIESVVIRGPI